MPDRSIFSTKRRICNMLERIPTGVPRSSLHAVTGDTALIHAALDELLAEGVVTERMYKRVRGKPRREYILTKNLDRISVADEPSVTEDPDNLMPGALTIVEHIVRQFPMTSRSEMWARAVTSKSWVAASLDKLVEQGRIKEVLEPDVRGGLIRKYAPMDSINNRSETNKAG